MNCLYDDITEAENLAGSCPCCNRFKGNDLGSIDPETKQLFGRSRYSPMVDQVVQTGACQT